MVCGDGVPVREYSAIECGRVQLDEEAVSDDGVYLHASGDERVCTQDAGQELVEVEWDRSSNDRAAWRQPSGCGLDAHQSRLTRAGRTGWSSAAAAFLDLRLAHTHPGGCEFPALSRANIRTSNK